jgi:hypothetical protein
MADDPEEQSKEIETKEEKKTEGTVTLFNNKPELETFVEEEYEDFPDDYPEEINFEVVELWRCYKGSETKTEMKKFHQILHTSLCEVFTIKDPIVTEIDFDEVKMETIAEIDNIYKSRVLKRYLLEDFDNDEYDYFLVYDMLADIITRYDEVSFSAACQMQNLEIPGLKERAMFDVILSELFQLPVQKAPQMHYITVANVLRKKMPLQALNLMIKKLPRMDPEIKIRFETFFALTMNHLDFQINFDVLKKVTDQSCQHYSHVKDLFSRMLLFTYSKKLKDILVSKKMPESWVTENYGEPVFTHGEDEEDIKKLSEKFRMKEESRDEFEQVVTGGELEAKETALDEVLLEVIFRKAGRNYSFFDRALELYASVYQTHLNFKSNVVKMIFKMFKGCNAKFMVFLELFVKHEVLSYKDALEWLGEIEQPTEEHYLTIFQIVKNLVQEEDFEQVINVFQEAKKMLAKQGSDAKHGFVVASVRHHQKVLKEKAKLEELRALFGEMESFKGLLD